MASEGLFGERAVVWKALDTACMHVAAIACYLALGSRLVARVLEQLDSASVKAHSQQVASVRTVQGVDV